LEEQVCQIEYFQCYVIVFVFANKINLEVVFLLEEHVW